jgi:POT family proton-dependent oligopeptide transporter
MNDPTATTTCRPTSRSFFGHPAARHLFMVEFFERFTYYGMRSMLGAVPRRRAPPRTPASVSTARPPAAVYALFTGRAYLLAIPGGWIADRLIGQRKAIFVGGLFIAAGNFILARPADPPCSIPASS